MNGNCPIHEKFPFDYNSAPKEFTLQAEVSLRILKDIKVQLLPHGSLSYVHSSQWNSKNTKIDFLKHLKGHKNFLSAILSDVNY